VLEGLQLEPDGIAVLEEPRYLRGYFPASIGLSRFGEVPAANAGDVARRYIDTQLLVYRHGVLLLVSCTSGPDTYDQCRYGFLTGTMAGLTTPKAAWVKLHRNWWRVGKSWGGVIQYQARVTKIITENNRAVGVQLASEKSTRPSGLNSTLGYVRKLLPAEGDAQR